MVILSDGSGGRRRSLRHSQFCCERVQNEEARALRRSAKPWLHQLTARVRAAIRESGLPEEFLKSNGMLFLEEDFADNAFVYATAQVMAIGEREDGWHTDGGASLLHAGLTIFGSRTLQVDVLEKGRIGFHHRPGLF